MFHAERACLAAAALVAVFVVGGCSRDKGEVSRDEFAREANGICARANRGVRRLGPEPPILTAEQANWITLLTEIDRAALVDLRGLTPPRPDRGSIESMLSAFARGVEKGAQIARASRAGNDSAFRRFVSDALDDLVRAQAVAENHGLDECARLGRVDR